MCIYTYISNALCFNTIRPRQNGRHFPDDIFKYIFIFSNENVWILIRISLRFVRHCLNQWWHISLTPIGVTRPQWVNLNIWLRLCNYAEISGLPGATKWRTRFHNIVNAKHQLFTTNAYMISVFGYWNKYVTVKRFERLSFYKFNYSDVFIYQTFYVSNHNVSYNMLW